MNKTEKRIARCLCLEILYAHASTGSNFTDILDNFFTKKNNILEYQLIDDQIKYASKLYDITLLHSKKVDSLIESKLVNWDMKRLALIDKIILRMSISEMLYIDDIPPKVSIAEGVEIAKEFSTKDSSGFVNGILDAVYNENFNTIVNTITTKDNK